MWLNASVKAPAIMVDVLLETTSGVVLESRLERLLISSSSTRRNGRYLFPVVSVVEAVGVVDAVGGLRLSDVGPLLSLRRLVESDRS